MIRLSVLDQSPIRAGGTPAQAIGETVRLAEACERRGYTRYWLAEHHASEGLAGTAPEVLIARVAAATEAMRVGSGGVMLSHYSPLKVAETFRVLEALYPGRIDLGIGRAPGSDYRTSVALQAGPGAVGIEQFPNQVQDLLAYVADDLPANHPFAGIKAQPRGDTVPDPWLLGSSDASAALAAYFGTAFSFAQFITDAGGPQIMALYREHFRPSRWRAAPECSIGVFVLCAEGEGEANRLALSRDLSRLRLEQGRFGPVPTVEEAESYPYTDEDRARIAHNRRRQVVGTPRQVKERLLELGALHGVEEFVVVTICHDFSARLKSYELLADAFALQPRSARGAAAPASSSR
jgi:luciferase family oxidoreductase group 1